MDEAKQIPSGKIAGDPRVTAYKRAARLYCEKMDIDPEQVLITPHPSLAGVSIKVPMWYTVAQRLYDFATIAQCIHQQAEEMRDARVARQEAAPANDQEKPNGAA